MARNNFLPRRRFLAVSLAVPGIMIAASGPLLAASTADTPLHIMKPAPLPRFNFTDAKGRRISLAHFHGKFVLLNIWASWYVPCRKDMASLDRLQAKLGGPRFQVVPVSIDTGGLAPVRNFYARNGIRHLGIYLDRSGSAMMAFNLQDIPAAFLINPQGKLIGIKAGGAAWNSLAMIAFLSQTVSANHSGDGKGAGR